MKKYELTEERIEYCGRTLYRIRALRAFGDVSEGELGGYIEAERNLSHEDNAWVYNDAKVYGDAEVCGDARVYGDAEVCGDARVCGDAKVCGNAWVCGNAEVCGDAWVCGNADYATASGFGSVYRTTTFFHLKEGSVGVCCGCFYGTLEEFRAKVQNTYPNCKKGREYLMLADLMEYRFSKEEDDVR